MADHDTHDHTGVPGVGGGGIIVQDEGTPLTTDATTLNFVGSGVSATGSGATKTITVSAGGGGLVLLEDHTASSSATLDFTTFVSGSYDVYRIVGTDLAPASNGVDLLMRMGTGGGPTYDSGTNYEWGMNAANNASSNSAIGGSGQTAGRLANSVSNNAGYGFACFDILIHNLNSTAHRKYAHGTGTWTTNSPGLQFAAGGFHWVTNGTAVTAIRVLYSSGNIASGTVRIYGLEN